MREFSSEGLWLQWCWRCTRSSFTRTFSSTNTNKSRSIRGRTLIRSPCNLEAWKFGRTLLGGNEALHCQQGSSKDLCGSRHVRLMCNCSKKVVIKQRGILLLHSRFQTCHWFRKLVGHWSGKKAEATSCWSSWSLLLTCIISKQHL